MIFFYIPLLLFLALSLIAPVNKVQLNCAGIGQSMGSDEGIICKIEKIRFIPQMLIVKL